jgi:ubiquinol-cytochrome c reductase cytochrome c subunit
MSERAQQRLGRKHVLGMAACVLAIAVPLGILFTPKKAEGRPRAQVSISASPSATPQPTSSFRPQDVEAGQPLYEERCATCHGEHAEGSGQGPAIAGLGPAYYDFMMSTGRMPIDQPNAQAKRRPPVLTVAQIRAITAYLTSIAPGGIEIPRVNPFGGNLSLGQVTYQNNCAPCHGTTGRGGAVGDQIAPPVVHASAVQVAEAVRIGPGTMPKFDATTIDQGTLDSLTAYVEYLRHPDDRGGSSLGGVGPLIEGFVALIGGLGLIVLVTRMIGTRS